MTDDPKYFNPDAFWVVMARRQTTAQELAVALRIRPSRIRKYLLGISEPTPETVERFADHFDWPLAYFYKTHITTVDMASCSL